MYTKYHKNRVVDPPSLAPREGCRRSPRIGKVGVVAGGEMPTCATSGRAPSKSQPRAHVSGIHRRVRTSQIHCRRAPWENPRTRLGCTSPPCMPQVAVAAAQPQRATVIVRGEDDLAGTISLTMSIPLPAVLNATVDSSRFCHFFTAQEEKKKLYFISARDSRVLTLYYR